MASFSSLASRSLTHPLTRSPSRSLSHSHTRIQSVSQWFSPEAPNPFSATDKRAASLSEWWHYDWCIIPYSVITVRFVKRTHTHDTFARAERIRAIIMCVCCRPSSFRLLCDERQRAFLYPTRLQLANKPISRLPSDLLLDGIFEKTHACAVFMGVCVFAKEDLLPARILKMLPNATVSLFSRQEAKMGILRGICLLFRLGIFFKSIISKKQENSPEASYLRDSCSWEKLPSRKVGQTISGRPPMCKLCPKHQTLTSKWWKRYVHLKA